MSALGRKLVRDLGRLKGQSIAIGLVMACGVATFVMSLSLLDSLTGTMEAYYARNRFAEVFAHLKRAPLSLVDRIAEIPGVGHAQGRIVERVTLDMPGLAEPASGQIVSLPREPDEGLNLVHLRSGTFPSREGAREVLVSQGFAEAHGLRPGDSVEAVMNGRLERLRVVGTALSPEYVYLIAPGSILPEKKRFGVFWMARDQMEAAFDMEGAFNDVAISVMPGASEAEIIERVDELTARYGGLGAYGREDQASHKFVANEIRELRGMTLIVPVIFLVVAAFLLNIVLSRIVAMQREQIAVLKALGYTKLEVGRHYLGLVMLITLLAAAAGSAAGAWMGRGMTALYVEFFDFPSFRYALHPRVVVLGFVVSAASAGLGVARVLRAAMRLPPAEAMRPAAPESFRPTVAERMGLHRALPAAVRMILRQLERRPGKTAVSVLGIGLAGAILVVGRFTEDAVNYVLDLQFNRVMRYDVDVVLVEQTDDTALSTVRDMPGVTGVEVYRSLPVRIRTGHVERRTGLLGLERAEGLHRLLDMSGRPVRLPERGVVLSSVLGEALGVGRGDLVTVEQLEGRRMTLTLEVSDLVEDFSGLAAYMDLREMNRLLGEPNTIGGVYLTADALRLDELYRELHEAPRVAAVNVKAAALQNFRETIARSLALMRPFLIGFSVIIACGVVYNTARISLSERSRDLATLRVLGFTRREVSIIQMGELAIITSLAIPVGLVGGYALAWVTSASTESELVRIPFVVSPATFALSAIVVGVSSLVSGLVVQRRLDRLDLVSVLKSRE